MTENREPEEPARNAEQAGGCPEGVPADASAPTLKLTAWCPDDCDQSEAREYTGNTVREVAEQHAEHVYYEQGTQRDCYEVRVRATKGDMVREWDVTVDVEVEVSFSAVLAFPVKPKTKAAPAEPTAPTPDAEMLP